MQKQLKNGLTRISRKWFKILLLATYYLLLTTYCLYSQTTISYPLYLCEAGNPNDYRLFANGGGWDGFWYVGYNRVWIEKIFIPGNLSEYKKVFIGAKLGRMKSKQVYNNGKATLDKEAIPGDIFIAVSSTPSWKKSNWKFLTTTDNISFEGDNELAVEQVGESRWFWTEVRSDEINFGGENYIALWSTSAFLTDSSNSPIIAAAWGGKDANSFINDEIKGGPPQHFSTTTLKSPLTVFEPAIAIKFVPELSQNITVGLMGITEGENLAEKKVIYASVLGNEIQKVWLEISQDNKIWKKHGLISYTSPYIFSLNPKKLSLDIGYGNKKRAASALFIRVCATDIWENTGRSPSVKIFISGIDK
ncbi:MAG: hypothetical protein COS68_06890 [Elusimicrobia bacterium CG06_land_8_20_14_3_00_38_11]|nr:MAG: hypothetical protein COS68_06890 [Elusimicrobia bacterium CG06_land_8_20_14_3_00_38_11]